MDELNEWLWDGSFDSPDPLTISELALSVEAGWVCSEGEIEREVRGLIDAGLLEQVDQRGLARRP